MADERTDPQYKLRMPPDLKERIEDAARVNKRSMNAEMVARLESSFEPSAEAVVQKFDFSDVDTQAREAAAAAAVISMNAFSAAVAFSREDERNALVAYFLDSIASLNGVINAENPVAELHRLRNKIVHPDIEVYPAPYREAFQKKT